jgi:hypothetical protein
MLKNLSMAVGFDTSLQELGLDRLVVLLADHPLPVVLSDDAIAKMHDSLPMVLFCFDILLKFYEAREMDSVLTLK